MKAKGVIQTQVSRETGIAKSTILRNPCREAVQPALIRKLADYFEVDVSLLAANL